MSEWIEVALFIAFFAVSAAVFILLPACLLMAGWKDQEAKSAGAGE